MSFKSDVAELLDSFADLLEFKEDNPFKIKAFRNGATAIRNIEGDLEPLVKDKSIKEIKGIGKGLQSIIFEYYEKGSSEEYDSLLSEIPIGVTDLLKIRGLGAKKIKTVIDELGVNSLEDLEKACREGKIAALKGFGKKTEESTLKEIERINAARNLVLQNVAEDEINRVINSLQVLKGLKSFEITGEFRRSCEVISKVEIVLQVENIGKFIEEINKKFTVKDNFSRKITSTSDTGKTFTLNYKGCEIESNIFVPVYLYFVDKNVDQLRLLYLTTGSKDFVDTYDISKLEHASVISEDEIFKKINIPYVIPEMREKEYLSAAPRLKENSDLDISKFKGLLHFHTTASDGKNTLVDMVSAAKELGFRYAVVCDHSKAAYYANGLNEDRILLQNKDIKKVASNLDLPVFQGIESDILKEGELDYTEDFLKNFDFIVASIHSRFNMTESEMTGRIIKAIENPYTDLLGHPTGRLLLSRAPYQINLNKIIDACAANNVAIEINANPHRLDLDWRNIYYAREKGCLFAINPDAHSTAGIKEIKYGIRVARKAGLRANEVINCLDINDFKNYLRRKVKRNL